MESATRDAIGDRGVSNLNRRLPIGAEPFNATHTHFRVWAPRCHTVWIVRDGSPQDVFELAPEGDGYHAVVAPLAVGERYWFRLSPDKPSLHCDPASRFQPQGPSGPSEIIDPSAFAWTDASWRGLTPDGQVLYEMHIGTFTREGTWAAAIEQLPELKNVGITCLEVMPVNDFPGTFGWGYDGVNFFAPTRLYGRPDDFRRFVDRAHALGIGVILDVVYNHIGPEENCLSEFSEDYFTEKHRNEWGRAFNFDGKHNLPVREFFVTNVRQWIEEYHLDGFRFDATQAILDDSPRHILSELSEAIEHSARGRGTLLVAENEPQHTIIARPRERGGYGLTALWNDDFHHSASVALTGRHEAYYSDHRGQAQEFVSAAKWGYLFQGQQYRWQKKPRGTPAFDLPPTAFINFIENHDQVANSAAGKRTHQLSSPSLHRAITALLLLSPQTPMLFQGQEFSASTPFFYFAGFKGETREQVRAGRGQSLAQFPSIAGSRMQALLAEPGDQDTFARSKLDAAERKKNVSAVRLHTDLLRLRREEPALKGRWPGGFDGAAPTESLVVLRYFHAEGDDRVLIVNLGSDFADQPLPEPLLGPPLGKQWEIQWHSEDPDYDGTGVVDLIDGMPLRIQGHSAMLLKPVPEAKRRLRAPVSEKA